MDKWYISGMYCQLGDYIIPTYPYHLLGEPETTIDLGNGFKLVDNGYDGYDLCSS